MGLGKKLFVFGAYEENCLFSVSSWLPTDIRYCATRNERGADTQWSFSNQKTKKVFHVEEPFKEQKIIRIG
jgi:hypothetical protein